VIPETISLDTSVVLRLLMATPPDQFQKATRFLEEQLEAGLSVHVGDLVFSEAYFALQSFYQLSKEDAIRAMMAFVEHGGVTVSPNVTHIIALPNLASAKPGFVDRLIHGESHGQGHKLVTFEKAAKKLPGTLVL
jgi:predicted nucleic-acid-binding protein